MSENSVYQMSPSEYQRQARRTLISAPEVQIEDLDIMIVWNAIGLAGEAGEICELVKKGIFHRHGLDKDKIALELGDLLWYVAALCTKLGLDLGEVMAENIEKLEKRYPEGFSSDSSIGRLENKKGEG